jgi:hypothetical protein
MVGHIIYSNQDFGALSMDRFTKFDDLRKLWIDQYVRVNEDKPELKRFAGIVGRVVSVNYTGKALVDFQDGAWYDIPAADDHLTRIDPEEGKAKYKNVNSAQVIPEKQG